MYNIEEETYNKKNYKFCCVELLKFIMLRFIV